MGRSRAQTSVPGRLSQSLFIESKPAINIIIVVAAVVIVLINEFIYFGSDWKVVVPQAVRDDGCWQQGCAPGDV